MSQPGDRKDEQLDRYFAEGKSWATDRHDLLRRSRGIAWIVAGVACVIALCEALALVALTPLKTVVPYTLLVDRQTGYVQALKPLDPQTVAGDSALTQSFLVQYVIAREGYDLNALQSDYRKVALWSGGPARADYLSRMQASNPDSPLALYTRSTVIEADIKSVSTIARNVAMVRFDTRRRDAGGQVGQPQAWVAIVRYSYSGEPMSIADRLVNPLGFRVLSYRRSAELLPPPSPPQPQPAVPGVIQSDAARSSLLVPSAPTTRWAPTGSANPDLYPRRMVPLGSPLRR